MMLKNVWRDVRVVDRAALEMPCPLPDPGFESRTLRHRRHKLCIACDVFLCKKSSLAHAAAPLPEKSVDFSGTP